VKSRRHTLEPLVWGSSTVLPALHATNEGSPAYATSVVNQGPSSRLPPIVMRCSRRDIACSASQPRPVSLTNSRTTCAYYFVFVSIGGGGGYLVRTSRSRAGRLRLPSRVAREPDPTTCVPLHRLRSAPTSLTTRSAWPRPAHIRARFLGLSTTRSTAIRSCTRSPRATFQRYPLGPRCVYAEASATPSFEMPTTRHQGVDRRSCASSTRTSAHARP